MKRIYLLIIAALALLVLAWALLPAFASRVSLEDKTVTIEPGMGTLDIAEVLSEAGVIRRELPFTLYVFITGNARRLQAGEYRFDGEFAPYEIADLLSEGFSLSRERRVTIVEGTTVSQIEDTLREAGITGVSNLTQEKAESWSDFFGFLRSSRQETLEGFLFPDTYAFETESVSSVVVRKMLVNFEEKTRELRERAEREGRDFYEVLTLASILEEEVPPKDMKRASGVLTKRLDAGMALQTDATLVYALGRPLTRADITTLDSPYNTYRYRGLPPTPISNPGLDALYAAMDPEDNEYWYYLTRSDTGETVFSRTFAEHSAARAQYLR